MDATRLHESIAAKFPKLSRYNKALIRRVSPWELAAGKSVHKSGKSAGKEWVTSTPQSQRWFLQVVGMQAQPPNDECDLDLEELSAACGFLKKKKAYNSQVSNVIRDLEAARRIARIRRFDSVTGACLRTITRLAGKSGFIPEHQATAPAATKAHWPKDRSESNAAVLFDVIYELAGGIGKNCHASVRMPRSYFAVKSRV